MSTKKTVTEVKFPTLTTEDNEGFKQYLAELGRRSNMQVKTWDKIPGRHAIEAYGRNIALITLNNNGRFSVHTNETMLSELIPGSKVIKNGSLSVYITKCDNVPDAIKLIEELVQVRYKYAKDKEVIKAEVGNLKLVVNPVKETKKKSETKPAKTSKKKSELVFKEIKHEPNPA